MTGAAPVPVPPPLPAEVHTQRLELLPTKVAQVQKEVGRVVVGQEATVEAALTARAS